jgi:PAS domain S-box-containing protein
MENYMQKKMELVIVYIITSLIWIFGTNYLIHKFVPVNLLPIIERSKEILYVMISGGALYFFICKMEELHASKEDERRLSTLINSMVDFVNFKDGEGKWIEANEFGLKLFQLENVDYRGKKDSELAEYTEFYREALRFCENSDEEAWKNGTITRIEERLPVPDGTTKIFDTIKVPLFNEDGSRQGLVIIGRDITERINMAKQLAQSKQQYKSLFEYNPDIVYMIKLNGTITNLNSSFEAITSFKRDDFIGRKITDVLPKRYKHYLTKFLSSFATEIMPSQFEIKIPHANGNTLTIQCTSLPIVVDGNITGIIGYGKDVTALRLTEERLRRTEKLSVVGELSASVAHEIRNPLTSLKGFVQMLQSEDTAHQLYYQIMLDELNRINDIVGELLLLAKPQVIKYTKVELQKLLNDVISLLSTEATLYNVEIDASFPETNLVIDCEPNQLKQMLINIIKNSIEATSVGGMISIVLKQTGEDHIAIIVKDNGCGISKERLARIGEPFYSSKEKGTGLGLTVSFKIVQAHKGSIHFESQKNQGTTVHISLPINQKYHRSPEM